MEETKKKDKAIIESWTAVMILLYSSTQLSAKKPSNVELTTVTKAGPISWDVVTMVTHSISCDVYPPRMLKLELCDAGAVTPLGTVPSWHGYMRRTARGLVVGVLPLAIALL